MYDWCMREKNTSGSMLDNIRDNNKKDRMIFLDFYLKK